MGTKINNRKDITKSGINIFFSNEVSIAEIANIIKNASMVKIKCFVYHYALNWLKTWFTCCVHLTKVVHFGISLIRFAPI